MKGFVVVWGRSVSTPCGRHAWQRAATLRTCCRASGSGAVGIARCLGIKKLRFKSRHAWKRAATIAHLLPCRQAQGVPDMKSVSSPSPGTLSPTQVHTCSRRPMSSMVASSLTLPPCAYRNASTCADK